MRERCLNEDPLKLNFKQTLEWVSSIDMVKVKEPSSTGSPSIRASTKKGSFAHVILKKIPTSQV